MKLFSHIAFTLLAAFLFSESVCAQESLPTIGRQSELVEGQTHLGIQVTNLTDKDLQAIERIGLDSGAGAEVDSVLLSRRRRHAVDWTGLSQRPNSLF